VIGAGLTEGVNLLVRAGDDVLQVHLMAVDFGRLGLLLPTFSDPAELADPLPCPAGSRLVSQVPM